MEFPAVHSPVFHTEKGTSYLKAPCVVLIAQPSVSLKGVRGFLDGFDESLEFKGYLDDPELPSAEQLCKFAGQLCYMSLGPKRTLNANASTYFQNIKSSGHGSVLEHANWSFLFYGISRSVTHELVRHRAGFGFSQVSQRYVSGKVLRFVERPEYQDDPELHEQFTRRIDTMAATYEEVARMLFSRQRGGAEILSGEEKTDLRKRVNQAARSVLPNETEAPIVVTANARAWRHFIEMRANPHAEVEIRALAFGTFLCLKATAPILFDDYEEVGLPDGTWGVTTKFSKV